MRCKTEEKHIFVVRSAIDVSIHIRLLLSTNYLGCPVSKTLNVTNIGMVMTTITTTPIKNNTIIIITMSNPKNDPMTI